MWAPTSEPFSTTQTLISLPASAAFCFRRQAADRPAGPAPTMTTSNSMYSRSTGSLLLIKARAVALSYGCGAFAAVLRNGGTVAGQMTDYTVLSWPRIISTPLGGSNTNVCLNLPQASKITGTRLEGDRFAVLTGLGVTVKIRAVLRSP
ncbi:hypothetical protein D3C71_1685620 [compost metagenome]